MADRDNGRNWVYYDPLRLYDCCPMSDAVAACILTAEPQAVQVVGVGSATDLPTVADRGQFASFPATVMAARYAYGMAGVTDIRDMAHKLYVNMHDPFSSFGPVNLVDLGLVDRQDALHALLDDEITGPKGRFPTNLSGGLLARAIPSARQAWCRSWKITACCWRRHNTRWPWRNRLAVRSTTTS